jgi:hypothetical protein
MVAVTPDDLRPSAVRHRRLISSLLLLLLLGFISLAAVREATADCSNEYLVADGGVTHLTTDDGKYLTTGRIWLDLAGMKLLLPEGVQPILSELGLMPVECR